MSPRKYAPLLIGALLLTTLLLLYFSRSIIWDWNRADPSDGITPVEPADNGRIAELSTDLFVNVSLPKQEYDQLLERSNRFMLEHPHIKVHIVNEEDNGDRFQSLLSLSAQNMAPDIMLLDNGEIIPLAVKGYLKPVDNLMTGEVMSDQLPRLIEAQKWNGYIWGMPHRANPFIVAWNKDLLAESGQVHPPEEWAAFRTMSERLSAMAESSEDHVYTVHFSPGTLEQLIILSARLHGNTKDLINVRAMSQQLLGELLWLRDTDAIASVPLEQGHQLSQLLADNKLMMVILPWEELNQLSKSARSKLLIEQDQLFYPWLNGTSFGISSGSESENEAMLWIQEVTSPYNSLKDFEEGGKLPVRPSLYDGMNLLTKTGDTPPQWSLQALSLQEPESYPVEPDPQWPMRWNKWTSAWNAAGEMAFNIESFALMIESHDGG